MKFYLFFFLILAFTNCFGQLFEENSTFEEGIQFLNSEEFKKASLFFEQILQEEKVAKTPDEEKIIIAQGLLAKSYKLDNKPFFAVKLYKELFSLTKDTKFESSIPKFQWRIAQCFYSMNQFDSALFYNNLAIENVKNWENKYIEAHLYKLSAFLIENMDTRQSILDLKKSAILFEEAYSTDSLMKDVPNELFDNFALLAKFFYNKNNIDSSYYFANKALSWLEYSDQQFRSVYLDHIIGRYLIKDKPKEAIKRANNILIFFKNTQEIYSVLEAYDIKAEAFLILGEMDSVVRNKEKIIQIAEKNSYYFALLFDTYHEIAFLYKNSLNNYSEAIKIGKTSLKKAKQLNIPTTIAYQFLLLGEVDTTSKRFLYLDSVAAVFPYIQIQAWNSTSIFNLIQRMNYIINNEVQFIELSMASYNFLLEAGSEIGSDKMVQYSIFGILDLYQFNNRIEDAEIFFENIQTKLSFPIANLYYKMANLHLSIDEYEVAYNYLEKSKEDAHYTKNKHLESLCVVAQAKMLTKLGLEDKLTDYILELKEIEYKDTSKNLLIGDIYLANNNIDSAIVYYKIFKANSDEKNNPLIYGSALLSLGDAFLSKLYYDSAQYYYKKAIDNCLEFGKDCNPLIKEIHFATLPTLLNNGETEKAAILVQELEEDGFFGKLDIYNVLELKLVIGLSQIFQPFYDLLDLEVDNGELLIFKFLEMHNTLQGDKRYEKQLESEFTNEKSFVKFKNLQEILFDFHSKREDFPLGERKKIDKYFGFYSSLVSAINREFLILVDAFNLLPSVINLTDNSKANALKDTKSDYLNLQKFSIKDHSLIISYNYNFIAFADIISPKEYYTFRCNLNVSANELEQTKIGEYIAIRKKRGVKPIFNSASNLNYEFKGGVFPKSDSELASDAFISSYYSNISGNENYFLKPKGEKDAKIMFDYLVWWLNDYNYPASVEVENLIIIPHSILNYIPYETLIDSEGNFLVNKYNISYSPAFRTLKEDNLAEKDNNYTFLAMGKADFKEFRQDETLALNNLSLSSKRDLIEIYNELDFKKKEDYNSLFERIGVGAWDSLPGVVEEIVQISNIYPQLDMMLNLDASETLLKELSKNGDLANYNILHIASHGIAFPEITEMSSIVLSPDEYNDGYLRIPEILDLNISADLVNLSACQTAFGELVEGEGMVGIGHAFLNAGASNVIVSLWNVNDKSTSLFMKNFYFLLKKHPGEFSFCLSETKRQFINGDFGIDYKNPYYWAPFILYSN